MRCTSDERLVDFIEITASYIIHISNNNDIKYHHSSADVLESATLIDQTFLTVDLIIVNVKDECFTLRWNVSLRASK